MSRILRRPMFRGGPVDSRGTGITTGLDQPRIGARNGRFFGDTGNPFVAKPITRQGIIDAYTPRGIPQPFIDFFRANQANQIPSSRFRTTTPGSSIEEAEGLFASASGASDVTKNLGDIEFGLYDDVREQTPKLGVGSDLGKDISDRFLSDDLERDTGLEAIRQENIDKMDNSPKEVKTPKPGDDEPEVTMTDLEKALGLDRARQEYAADALAAASKAFFEGKGFGAIADAAAVKSKAPDIKRVAALEEFKADRAEKLYEKKLSAQAKLKLGTRGALEKDIDALEDLGENSASRKIGLKKIGFEPTLEEAIKKLQSDDPGLQRPSPSIIIGMMNLYYPTSFKGVISGDTQPKEDGTYILNDASALIIVEDGVSRLQKL